MITRSALLALALSCFSVMANAGIITLEYTGHVTTALGEGAGHAIGESVSGKLEIDLSKATFKFFETPTSVGYLGDSTNGLILNNGFVGSANGADFVDIYNDSHVNWLGETEDFFQIIDTLPTASPYNTEDLQITLTLKGFDWLTDLSLNNININTSDAFTIGASFGALSRTQKIVDANGNINWISDADIFSLDSVKLVSTQVPEPSSTALIALGGLALFLRRRRA